MKLLKRLLTILLCTAVLLFVIFLIGRYGWKLGGFRACESAGIEQVHVEENQVRICGFYPGSFPQGFLGYHAEQVDSTLYVGFQFSGLFGFFETGDFDITIPTEGIVSRVMVKTGEQEYPIWPEEDEPLRPDTLSAESGIYVRLERDDVYSVDWYFENQSGGVANADGTALKAGKNIYLDNDIFFAAANLERPVPVMLTFSDKDGTPIARANTSFDSQSPLLIVTLTADAGILVNGVAAEESAVPTVYEQILNRCCTALEEIWDGQQLTDAGLNLMLRDVAPETMGYAVEDLDDNGIPELAIGTISGDDFYGKLIFGLYTVNKNGETIPIFSSMERDRYYYAGGNRFANLGSSSATDSFVATLKLEGEGLVDMTFTSDPAEYVQMELVSVIESDGYFLHGWCCCDNPRSLCIDFGGTTNLQVFFQGFQSLYVLHYHGHAFA